MTDLLIAGASVRAATQSAVAAGFAVAGADLFADRDTVEIASCVSVNDYPNQLLSVRQQFPGTPVLYTGAIENYPCLIAEFAAAGPLLGNNDKVVRAIRDPFELQHVLKKHRLPFPATSRDPPQNSSQCWLRKSVRSAGGQHVARFENKQLREDEIVQEFVEGTVASGAYVSNGRRCAPFGVSEMLVGCDWLGADGFQYCGSITRHCDSTEFEKWKTLGEVLAREFRMLGVFGIDAIIHNDQIVPVEVNPRYTASMELHERVSGLSVVGEHVSACRHEPLSTQPGRGPATAAVAGKAILFATYDSIVPDQFTTPPKVRALADLPAVDQTIPKGHPLLTILVDGNSRDHAIRLLRDSVQDVRSQFLRE